MVKKDYSPEFRQQAVELYENTPGATASGIASDLGVAPSTLGKWIARHGSGKTTRALGAPTVRSSETLEQKVQRLEAELKVERSERKKLETEKSILKAAAKYFAGETNW